MSNDIGVVGILPRKGTRDGLRKMWGLLAALAAKPGRCGEYER